MAVLTWPIDTTAPNNFYSLQMARIIRPNRNEQLEECARIYAKLSTLGACVSPETIEKLLVAPTDTPLDDLMLRLPHPGVPHSYNQTVRGVGGMSKKKHKGKKGKKAKQ
jgi:hypothetical protein